LAVRGVATGVYEYLYLPPTKKSVQVDFLWGKNDVKMAIEHESLPKKFYTPQNKFLATPLLAVLFVINVGDGGQLPKNREKNSSG